MSDTATTGTRRPVQVASTLDELLEGCDSRSSFLTSDSLSGSRFEHVTHDGEQLVLKYVSVDDDWIMRATGDIDCRALRLFGSDIAMRMPACIDHATVAVAPYRSRAGHGGAVLLMHDVAALLVPPGGDVITPDAHRRFLGHMAAMHATFWGMEDTIGLMPLAHHYMFLTPTVAEIERGIASTAEVPKALGEGWSRLHSRDPHLAATLGALAHDPDPLLNVLDGEQFTLVHGDWKLGNLGEHSDGTTVLLDWDRCGAAPATLDLAWYLAVNCDRLPESKEAAISAYREALEGFGVAVESWWEKQLRLTLLGAALQLAWSKTDDTAELGWWADRVAEAEPLLA